MVEFLLEAEWRRPHDPKADYAGGMTESDILEVRKESDALRAKIAEREAKKNGTASA